MANSTSPVPQVVEGTGAVAKLNQLIDAMSQSLIGGKNWGTSALLVWGYLGGRVNGINVANGTLALGASTTSYVVMKKSDGVVSFATATTNWNDSTNYWRLYSVVTDATTVTSYNDERFSTAGLFGSSGGGGGSFTGGTLTSALNEAPVVTIASSATPAIGAAAGNTISITGTTTITGFDTIASGALRKVVFAGALILTHNGTSLILPTAANVTTAAGDAAEFLSLGSGNWRCVQYERANGNALTGASDRSAVSVLTPSSGVVNIDCSLGDYFTLAPTANVTSITFSNLPGSGKGASLMIRFTQDTTARTVAWPASFRWEGTAPAVSTVSGAVDVLAITTFDNGTKWDATLSKARA